MKLQAKAKIAKEAKAGPKKGTASGTTASGTTASGTIASASDDTGNKV